MIKLKDLLSENKQGYDIAMARLRGDKKTEEKLVKTLRTSMLSKYDIEDMVKKEMPQAKKDFEHEQLPSTHYDKRNEPSKWTPALYKKWIKQSASGGGYNHSYDMAQNAKNEPGLLQFVKTKIDRSNDPLDRIQWDIESYAK